MTRLVTSIGSLLIGISVIIAACGSGSDKELYKPERISIGELNSFLDNQADVVILDVRSKESYDKAHIPGAVSMTYPDEIRARNHELPLDKTIILYCSRPAEQTSASSAKILEEEFGFHHDLLRVLKGGFPGWQQAGHPVEAS